MHSTPNNNSVKFVYIPSSLRERRMVICMSTVVRHQYGVAEQFTPHQTTTTAIPLFARRRDRPWLLLVASINSMAARYSVMIT